MKKRSKERDRERKHFKKSLRERQSIRHRGKDWYREIHIEKILDRGIYIKRKSIGQRVKDNNEK